MRKEKKNKRPKLSPFWIGTITCTVIGSVMASGLGELGRKWIKPIQPKNPKLPKSNDGVYMLAMILPMTAVMLTVVHFVYKHTDQKTAPLIDAIRRVGEGELDVQLDPAEAGEYSAVYESFNAMVRELRATKAEMDSFVNTFTHEFKTPITSIKGFAELLIETADGIEDEERMEYLQLIAEQSARLSRLSQNTLLLSKLEATQIVTEREHFSLSNQIRQCCILLYKEMEKKHITLQLPEPFDVQYAGNAELTEHIWMNLLQNAVKFTPEGGTISVGCQRTADTVQIRISDTGTGMTPETMAHIFEKYYQHDTASLVKGNGIGLAIVRRVVTLCGGRVDVQSTLGKGSSFTVTLPVTA